MFNYSKFITIFANVKIKNKNPVEFIQRSYYFWNIILNYPTNS